MRLNSISLSAHAAIEIIAAPLLIAAPFVLGFGGIAGATSLVLGAILLGLAVSTTGEQRTIPISAHAGFDYVIGFLTIATGIGLGIASGEPAATAFLVGFGAAHIALTASTRYSVRGA